MKELTEKRKRKIRWAVIAVISSIAVLSIGINIVQWKKAEAARILLPETTALGDPTEIQVSSEITLTSAMIAEKLSVASELITSEYTYTNYEVYEKNRTVLSFKVPFTTDKSLFLYNGTIFAGIDLSEVKISVDNDKKVITLTLPPVQKISHEIDYDSFQIFDINNSVFTSTSLEEYTELIDVLKEEQEQHLADGGYYGEVLQNTKQTIREILEISGLTDSYSISFKS